MASVPSSSDQVAGALEKLSIGSQTETPEVSNKDIYGNNGTLIHQQSYGYAPYGSYPSPNSTVPTMGNDGQLYATQHYQYPTTPFYHGARYSPNSGTASQVEVPTSAAGDKTNGTVNKIDGPKPFRPVNRNSSSSFNSSYNQGAQFSPSYHDPRYGYDGYQSPVPWVDASMYPNGLHATSAGVSSHLNFQPSRPISGLGQASGAMNMVYPYNRVYDQYGYQGGAGFGSSNGNSWTNGRGWVVVDSKYRTKGRGFGNENVEGLSELNRGPRGKGLKNQSESLVVAEPVQSENVSQMPDDEHYNMEDFPEDYSNAKFFVIKSYSEDDVHKSIKYGVWASTPNGNRKLDAAYKCAKENSAGCPVFLLFSVNTSGHFVGLAEMMGPVDFNKTVDYWQQEKWIGCFPVKWHIIKDVPNSSLRHITLENNENKPVTNSRDTQEVILEKGIQVLKIFKSHKGKGSILDDFEFYAARERIMQETRAKRKIQKQVSEGKTGDDLTDTNKNIAMDSQKPIDGVLKEPVAAAAPTQGKMNGEVKVVEMNVSEEKSANNGNSVV
ncbi:YTH domain-containing protein ECT2-like [Euphorbia lathyris]|uniref:YTH domain-containing protein ECT2-like n=1 Tax=Euphorbia lathyris TaxID=212925 RepID=UPI0033138211